jgi:hypothetical protein
MMKRSIQLLAGVALLTATATPVLAACRDEIASLSPGTTTGSTVGTTGAVSSGQIAKDGSTAPLQSTPGSAGQSASAQGHQGIAKDGSTMPLANQPGTGNTAVATSQQDVQAQQRGGPTAAATGQSQAAGARGTGSSSPQFMAALDRARTLQQQGNETGCMQAIEEAKRLRQ